MTGQRDNLRDIIHAALLAPSPLARYREQAGRRERLGDLLLVASGGFGPQANNVLVLGAEPPERVFAVAERFYGGAGGYGVTLEVETATAMEAALLALEWQMDEEEPALTLAPIPATIPPPPAGLDIRPVTDQAGYRAFLAHAHTSTIWVPSLAAALDPAVALFLGYVQGEVVASSRLTCLGLIVEIAGVVTAPERRRQGFGTALTWAAIAEGVRRGCTAATLTATAMGLPVYLEMGFTPVCTFRTYLPPAPHAT